MTVRGTVRRGGLVLVLGLGLLAAAAAGAAPATAADVPGHWCFFEQEGFGQVVPEKVEIQLTADGRYRWTEGSFEQRGRWQWIDGQLAMSQIGRHEVLSAAGEDLRLRRMGSTMKLSRGPCPADRWSTQDRIAFHNAAARGDLQTVEQFLARGLAIDTPDPSRGDTALVKAAKFCRVEVARHLLARGAGTQIANDEGRQALDYARRSPHHGGCDALVELLTAPAAR